MLLNLSKTKVIIHMRDVDDLHTKYSEMEQIRNFIRSIFALFRWACICLT